MLLVGIEPALRWCCSVAVCKLIFLLCTFIGGTGCGNGGVGFRGITHKKKSTRRCFNLGLVFGIGGRLGVFAESV